jgi:hypothetical protein
MTDDAAINFSLIKPLFSNSPRRTRHASYPPDLLEGRRFGSRRTTARETFTTNTWSPPTARCNHVGIAFEHAAGEDGGLGQG